MRIPSSAYRRDVSQYHQWLDKQGLALVSANAGQLQLFLGDRLTQGASPRSTARFLSSVRSFYRWALRENLVSEDPSLRIESPKQGRPLPKALSETDVERLLGTPDIEQVVEFRDRTMLELLYACGLRVSELVRTNPEPDQSQSRRYPSDGQGQQGAISSDGRGGAGLAATLYSGPEDGFTSRARQ